MARILITGGAGFVGSHLAERLLGEGHDVLVADNYFTGSKHNVDHLLGNSRFELIRHDITLSLTVEVDFIYNLACPASPIHYQHNPIKTIKCNTVGMVNMLGLAKRTGARILQASTSEVYGDPLQHPQKEEYWGNVNPIGIRSCYDEGKRVAETLCMDYHRREGVEIRIIRIFNTYGPRMAENDGRVVSNFILQALRGEPITIYGDGSQTRSFCFVSDLVDGMIRLMNSDEGLPVNVGNPYEVTIKEFAEKVIELTGSKSELVFKDLPKDDPTRRRPDISKAKAVLDWKPKVGLDEGLRATIEYFKTKCGDDLPTTQ